MNSFMKTFLAALLAFVVANILIGIFAVMILSGIAAFSKSETVIKDGSVLRIDLSVPINDNPTVSPFDDFDFMNMRLNRRHTLLNVLDAIERAAFDDRIRGIFLDLNNCAPQGMATMEEVRNALLGFKESGKFILSYADFYGQGAYYMATVADKIYMNPEGGIDWKGLSSTVMFFKGLMDKIGLQAEIIRHGQFKAAVEPFMQEKMSPANRLQTETLITTIWDSIVKNVSDARRIPVDMLQLYADQQTVESDARKAMEVKMVDELLYLDEVEALLTEMTGRTETPEYADFSKYISLPKDNIKLSKNKIAVIYAEGDIVDGEGERGQVGGQSLAATLAKALKDDQVKALVFRVNSPGGSALASEVIWRQVEKFRARKPVIVSMGNYAASGGYYISCPADAILASRSTLTGSIGVFGLMFNGQKTFNDKLGITFDAAKTNASADLGAGMMGIGVRALTPVERDRAQQGVERIYNTFVGRVATGRNMSAGAVDSIGQGRVWSGTSALGVGLIDGFGGLKDAIALAADRAGVADDYRVSEIKEKNESPFEMILNMMSGSVRSEALTGEAAEILRAYKYVEGIMSRNGVQAAMPYKLEIR